MFVATLAVQDGRRPAAAGRAAARAVVDEAFAEAFPGPEALSRLIEIKRVPAAG